MANKRTKVDPEPTLEEDSLVDTTWIELDKDGTFYENEHLMVPKSYIPKIVLLIRKHNKNEIRLSALMYLLTEYLRYSATADAETRATYSQSHQFPILHSQLSGEEQFPETAWLPRPSYNHDEDTQTAYFSNVFLWTNFDRDRSFSLVINACDCEYEEAEQPLVGNYYPKSLVEACDMHRDFRTEELTVSI